MLQAETIEEARVLQVTVVLPSLDPDEKMVQTVNGLLARGFRDIVIVNDGSDDAHLEPFKLVGANSACTILTHQVNKGKGTALKTAFDYVREHRPESEGVVTVDGDGQHHTEDIYACAKEMLACGTVVLGVRSFARREVPFKSRYGNNITKFAFRVLCGIRISDTQTGLRAIPAKLLSNMLRYEGERFEYETNMLLEMKREGIPFIEVPIRTIYLEDNASSHFHPFRDSFRIYKLIFKYSFSALCSVLVDLLMFYVLSMLLGKTAWEETFVVYVATFGARVLSSFFNYNINRALVFRSTAPHAVYRYYLLCILQMLVSASIVYFMKYYTSTGDFGTTLWKALVDTLLFFVSFQIQREWVFRERRKGEDTNEKTR